MLSIRRILVPLDDTPLSRQALDTAVSLAERFDARLYPVYVRREVIEDRPDLDELDTASDIGSIQGTVRAVLADGHTLALAAVYPEVRTGPVHEAILAAAEEHGVDLIVMGTHGRHGVGDWLRGSTTERVMVSAKCAVYVLRENPDE